MILVVGPGGVGQSYFIDLLNKQNIFTNKYDNSDFLKHIWHPMLITNIEERLKDIEKEGERNRAKKICEKYPKVEKCIFIFSDPCKSVMSHFRRGWANHQLSRLNNPYNLDLESISKGKYRFEDYENFVKESKKDCFGIENQFDSWLNCKDFPILFINFYDIENQKEKIEKFLDNKASLDNFVVKKRNSDNQNKVSQEFINIYSKLYLKMNKYSGKIINEKVV